jgi:Flp pilus assembly protein TadG
VTVVQDILARFRRDQGGATAVEYALVLPSFVLLLFGVISTAQLGGAISGLHFAVEEAARCSAVNVTACGTSTTTVSFAQARYHGPAIGAAFTSTTDGCGHTVRATGVFKLELAFTTLNVPLQATACYPGKDT